MHQTLTYALHRPADRFSPGLRGSSPTASSTLKYAMPTLMIFPRRGSCGKTTWANQVRQVAINYNSKSFRSTSGSTNTATTRRYLAKILYGIAESLPIPLLFLSGRQPRRALAHRLWLVVRNFQARIACETYTNFVHQSQVIPDDWPTPTREFRHRMYFDLTEKTDQSNHEAWIGIVAHELGRSTRYGMRMHPLTTYRTCRWTLSRAQRPDRDHYVRYNDSNIWFHYQSLGEIS
jgi:hypothetical protein